MRISGGEMVVRALQKEKVDTVFGYPGGAALPLYDALYNCGLRHILTRHEQGAVHAADGYARVSGRVGVCISTSGPGATNLVTGIATAYMDSVPLVCITCQVASALLGKDSFQEADVSGITTPITKHNFMVKDINMLCQILAEAFYIAQSGRPGPVVVDIPKDIFTQEGWFDYPETIELRGYRPQTKGSREDIILVANALAAAQRPLLFIGGGAVSADAAPAVTKLLEKTGMPFVSSLMGLSLMPKNHPQNLGMLGMHGTYAANMAASNCDLLIALGARFDDRVTGEVETFAPSAKIAHFEIDPSEINKIVKVRYRVLGDLRWSMPLFAELAQEGDYQNWLNQTKGWGEQHPLVYHDDADLPKPQAVIEAVNGLLSRDAVIVTDVGQHQMWTAQFGAFQFPRGFVTSGGLGTMGYGLPAAIGAALALPGREVWLFTGDGSLLMNCQEILTGVELGLPLKVVILNNRGLGMVRQWQRLFFGNRYSHSQHQKEADFTRLAQAFDAQGLDVLQKEDLLPALQQAKKAEGPIFVNVRVADNEDVLPMVAPNASLEQMMHLE